MNNTLPSPGRLEERIRQIEPSVRFVTPRVLQRVVRWHSGMEGRSMWVPHARCWTISREVLRSHFSLFELGLVDDLPDAVLLLPEPADTTEAEPSPSLLLKFWRHLFHAKVDQAIDDLFRDDRLRDIDARLFFEALGSITREEIRNVLTTELRLPHPGDDRVLFREFIALFCELWMFAPQARRTYFPGILKPAPIEVAIRKWLNPDEIFQKTRPEGAPDPQAFLKHEQAAESPPPLPAVGTSRRESLKKAADAAIAKKNDVRAIVLLMQIGDLSAAEIVLENLTDRLGKALVLTPEQTAAWNADLRPLLKYAAAGSWSNAEKLLYDLQKACVDTERTIYAVELIEAIVTFGKKKIRRPLDKIRDIRVLRALRGALGHSDALKMELEDEEKIQHHIHEAMHTAEERIRTQMGPIIGGVLDEVGLIPTNMPERIAHERIIAELLDRIVERGFIRVSDLRDAIAANQLKLHDLKGPSEFIFGDPLIRANELLSQRLDGVYQRGEAYMRALQRGSSLAFGTSPGRFLTVNLLLPFGGAFMFLEAVHHLMESLTGLFHLLTGTGIPKTVTAVAGTAGVYITGLPETLATLPNVLVLGVFMLLMMRSHSFRSVVGRFAGTLLIDLPSMVLYSPAVSLAMNNQATRFFRYRLLTPLLTAGLVSLTFFLYGADPETTWIAGGVGLLLNAFFFRTPVGRGLEDRLNEVIDRFWRLVSINLLLNIGRFLLYIFRLLVDGLERAIYTVDEWLRFREGESSLSYYFKMIFGAFWFVITYVLRFAVNLLIEPQINPIKHFPVVTVSHKLLLPLIPSLAKTFAMTEKTTFLIVAGIPGIFGFLVWELKENWKLYNANRSDTLDPVMVGSHGEKMKGLLAPGFHSGAVPRTWTKMRRAMRQALETGNFTKVHKLEHQLEHMAEAVHRLVEREMIASLKVSRRWNGKAIEVKEVTLAVNRVRIELKIPAEEPLRITFEQEEGWLFACLEQRGNFDSWTESQKLAFGDVLTGLYKLAGVHLVREQLAHRIGDFAWSADVRPDAIIANPPDGERQFYRYSEDAMIHATYEAGGEISDVPAQPRSVLVLSDTNLGWHRWVHRWEEDQNGTPLVHPLLEEYCIPGVDRTKKVG